MEPPQAKMTSVPFSYQPLAMVCSSGEAEKDAAVLPGVVHLDLDAELSRGSARALHVAVAVTAASRVGAAAAAAEAELRVAFLNGSVAGEIAALLFLERDAADVLVRGLPSASSVIAQPSTNTKETSVNSAAALRKGSAPA